MEIGPIIGIRSLPETKGRSAKNEDWVIVDPENRGHANDETYTPGGESDTSSEDEFEESHPEADQEDSQPAESPEVQEPGKVSLFA